MPDSKYEFERLGRLPYNEFSEQMTGDMASMDTAWHHWLQDKYAEQFKKWEQKLKEK